jgi:hypothetical protein
MKLGHKISVLGFVALIAAGGDSLAQSNDGPADADMVSVKQLPNGGRPLEKVPFPEIVDWQTLKITLNRTRCLGNCPSYRIEIGADGEVNYRGRYSVAVEGKHQSRIPVERVLDLYQAFVKSDFFWTFDEYRMGITDHPIYTVTISFDDHMKKVIDYVGRMRGMPEEITQLENMIDAVAGVSKWLHGDESTVASLEAENWNFRSQDEANLKLIESAATVGNLELLRQLVKAGVRVDTVYGCKGMWGAAWREHVDVVKGLAEIGAPIHWDTADGTCNVLSVAAMAGSSAMVQAVLARQPDVNWQNPEGMTPLMMAASGFAGAEYGRDYGAVVRLLMNAGADVNLRDNKGRSAIMLVHDDDVAQALLKGGADPWAVDKYGRNALDIGRATPAALVLKRWVDLHPKQ